MSSGEQTLPCPSPCIGVCSTSVGDKVCRGCKRFSSEIAQWMSLEEDKKYAVEDRLQRLLLKAIGDKFTVHDPDQLQAWMRERHIRYAAHRAPLCWIQDLLNSWHERELPWSQCGIEVAPPWRAYSPAQLRESIDTSFYQLSLSYQQRYANDSSA